MEPGISTRGNPLLSESGLRIGVVGRLTLHDLRRGSAKHIANVEVTPENNGPARLTAVQTLLYRSDNSALHGVSRGYMGVTDDDFWTPRVKRNLQDPFSMPLIVPEESRYRERIHSSDEDTTSCAKFNIGHTTRAGRLQASRREKTETVTSWIKDQRNAVINSGGQLMEEFVCDADSDFNDDDDDDDDELYSSSDEAGQHETSNEINDGGFMNR